MTENHENQRSVYSEEQQDPPKKRLNKSIKESCCKCITSASDKISVDFNPCIKFKKLHLEKVEASIKKGKEKKTLNLDVAIC